MTDIERRRTSTEYLRARVVADVALDAQTVAISFDETTWHTAEWVGDPGTTRSAQILVGPSGDHPYPAGRFSDVFVKVTDNPEIPVQRAGGLIIL